MSESSLIKIFILLNLFVLVYSKWYFGRHGNALLNKRQFNRLNGMSGVSSLRRHGAFTTRNGGSPRHPYRYTNEEASVRSMGTTSGLGSRYNGWPGSSHGLTQSGSSTFTKAGGFDFAPGSKRGGGMGDGGAGAGFMHKGDAYDTAYSEANSDDESLSQLLNSFQKADAEGNVYHHWQHQNVFDHGNDSPQVTPMFSG